MFNWFLNLSLGKKQILALLISGLIPMLVVAWFSERVAEREVTQQAVNQLEAVRDIKAASISNYFNTVTKQIKTMSAQANTKAAMDSLARSFPRIDKADKVEPEQLSQMKAELEIYYREEFGKKYANENEGNAPDIAGLMDSLSPQAVVLQYKYIAQNNSPLGEKHLLNKAEGRSVYHRLHDTYHQGYRLFLEEFGFYDIFLIDIESGDVVYSVFKELDYATSLLEGPHSSSNLALAYHSASSIADGEVAFVDFKQYTPSYEAPAAFLATPVFHKGARRGVLVFQIPIEPINEIMSLRSGMGDTGESYLVGPDSLMRSDSYVDSDKFSVVSSFKKPEQGSVLSTAMDKALMGESGSMVVTSYHGGEVLSAYTTIPVGDTTWAVIAEVNTIEALAGVTAMIQSIVFQVVASIVLITLFAVVISRVIAKPILALSEGIKQVSEKGDFSIKVTNNFKDEVGETSRAFNGLLNDLSRAVSQSNHVLTELGKGNFSQRVDESFPGQLYALSKGVNDAVSQVEESTQAQEAQAAIAQENAEKAAEAAKSAEEQAKAASIVKQALDVSATAAFIADENLDIIYTNHALNTMMQTAESDFKEHYSSFDSAALIGNPVSRFFGASETDLLAIEGLSSTYSSEFKAGQRTFATTANPIRDDKGQKIGTVIEWMDRTSEVAIEQEIDDIITSASMGDFSRSLTTADKTGFFLSVSEGLNRLLSTTNVALDDIIRVFSALSRGDLSQTIDREYEGEFAKLKNDANATIEKLNEIIDSITQGSTAISSAAQEIATGNTDLSQRTEEQAASLEETSAGMQQMLDIVKNNEQNALSVNEVTRNSMDMARKGNESVQETIAAMKGISESSDKIADIIGVIDEIAFQTNLLALNAAVEAARAGEQGKGFAVVAGEVRNLAQRSSSAAKEIAELIKDSVQRVNNGSELVVSSGELLSTIVSEIEKVGTMMDDILGSAREQSQGIQQVNTALSQMDSVTQQNAALVEEASASSQNMAEQAHRLDEQVAFFRS